MRALTVAFLMAAAVLGVTGHAADAGISSSSAAVAAPGVGGNATEYRPSVAMEALFYAKAVSCSASMIERWTCASCGFNPAMKEVNVFTARETQAYVGYDSAKNAIVVAIRGSANIMNWIDNLTFELVPYALCDKDAFPGGCKVHKGFYEIYKALSVRMVPAVREALSRHPTASIFVTGHSMGAAISTLASLELYAETKNRVVNVYNFGCPRVGDPAFARYAAATLPQQQQFRIVHKADPVSQLPFREFGYLHVPQEVFYDHDHNRTWVECKDTATDEDQSCQRRYGLIPLGFSDHSRFLGVYIGCSVTADALAARPAYFDLTNGEADVDSLAHIL